MKDREEAGHPLYRRLAGKLRDSITDGEFAVGTLLPTEQELCDKYSTSRFTVREALRLLMEEGFVTRRQGRGTEVVSLTARRGNRQSLSSFSQLFSYAQETRLEIDRSMIVVPDEDLSLKLGRAQGRQWLLLEGIRRTLDGEMISVSHIFVHDEFAGIATELPMLNGAIHPFIEERFGVSTAQVQQTISMESARHAIAAQLGIKEGSLTVFLLRRYLAADDQPIIISFNWHDATDFRYTQVIRQ